MIYGIHRITGRAEGRQRDTAFQVIVFDLLYSGGQPRFLPLTGGYFLNRRRTLDASSVVPFTLEDTETPSVGSFQYGWTKPTTEAESLPVSVDRENGSFGVGEDFIIHREDGTFEYYCVTANDRINGSRL